MSSLKSLLGAGGGALPYISGRYYNTGLLPFSNVADASADRDYMHVFVPRADVTIDALGWVRQNTTAANVYRAIYDSSGSLLTDASVDSDITQGAHEISITPITLTAGAVYYNLINQSATVIHSDNMTSSSIDYPFIGPYITSSLGPYVAGIDWSIFSAIPTSVAFASSTMSRTNAAFPSSLTLTGWGNSATAVNMGIVPQ